MLLKQFLITSTGKNFKRVEHFVKSTICSTLLYFSSMNPFLIFINLIIGFFFGRLKRQGINKHSTHNNQISN